MTSSEKKVRKMVKWCFNASRRWRMVESLNKKTRVMTSWKSGSCWSKNPFIGS